MGKGNRNRQNAARGVLAGAGTRTAGKKQSNYKTWIGTLIVVLVLVALVLIAVGAVQIVRAVVKRTGEKHE